MTVAFKTVSGAALFRVFFNVLMYHSIDAVSVPCGFRVPDGNHPWVKRGASDSNLVVSAAFPE